MSFDTFTNASTKKNSTNGTLPKTEFDKSVLALVDSLSESLMLAGMGSVSLLKAAAKHPIVTIVTAFVSVILVRWITWKGYHLQAIQDSSPELFTNSRMEWFYNFGLNTHQWAILGSLFFFVSLVTGFRMRAIRKYFQNLFFKAGVKNGVGDTPKLVKKRKLDKYRTEYDFDANGIGLSEFKAASERIVAHFKMNVESMKHGQHQGRVLITFNKRNFPDKITFADIEEEKVLPPESFYVGYSMEGVVTQKIQELPHMLIAGTTGSGKSVFFKGALVSLLDSCKHLQLYIVDLKGGLEAIDFKDAPNVKIVKTMEGAVNLLKQVEKEMKARFDFLEANNLKSIVPGRDKKERIVVAVDEASVLYMNRSRYDDDYNAAMEARKLADSISKLSRAASIHLMLATQKLDKQVIPTSVSENISGRMAFRANSFQGSMVVLGSKDASDLPEIPGRGIWSVGNRKVIVQAPFIKDDEIKNCCKRIKNEFQAGERKLFNPLIGEEEKKKANEAKKSFDENKGKGGKK